MKINLIQTCTFINSISNHKKHKENLLKLIKKIPSNKFNNINHTDWNIPKDYKREYIDYFYENVVKQPMENIKQFHKCLDWTIQNTWFQQYSKENEHPWHTHPNCQYTNVYFLELSSESHITQIFDNITNKIISNIKVKEGDILTFPSYLLHRSKKIDDNRRKTIISFNSNFTNVNLELEPLKH